MTAYFQNVLISIQYLSPLSQSTVNQAINNTAVTDRNNLLRYQTKKNVACVLLVMTYNRGYNKSFTSDISYKIKIFQEPPIVYYKRPVISRIIYYILNWKIPYPIVLFRQTKTCIANFAHTLQSLACSTAPWQEWVTRYYKIFLVNQEMLRSWLNAKNVIYCV